MVGEVGMRAGSGKVLENKLGYKGQQGVMGGKKKEKGRDGVI